MSIFGGPPLFFARTEGSTPFRFSLHVGDVGHTLIVGPTGAGKSVLLALMALQFRRYAGAQIFAFDFGGSIRAAALAMGGDWHDLGGALADDITEPVALQPLSRIDDAGERAWAADWVAALLAREVRHGHPGTEGASMVRADLACVRAGGGTDDHRPLRPVAVQRAEAGVAALYAERPLGAAARCRDRASRRGGCAGVRDRGADRRGRRARRALLPVPPHRGSVRRPAHAAHHRRGMARTRRQRLRRPVARMAEDAAEEERERHLRHPVAGRYRRQRHRARDHRKLPDAAVPAE